MRDYGHELEFGVFTTPSAAEAESVVTLVQLAERVGLDLASFQDHPYQPAFLDTWTLLSFLAARTDRIRLATNVVNLPLRSPAVLARSSASLDLLSGGRVSLGLGAGAFWDGIEAMGGEKLTPGQSVDALEEAIRVLRALWDGEERSGARLEGEHYRLAGAKRGPTPAHRIEIWLGAYKPRMLRLTGRLADGWVPSTSYLEPGALGKGNETIDESARAAGRDPGEIRRLLNIMGSFGPGRGDDPLQGPPESWVEELCRLATVEGIGTFIVAADDAATIETFATAVAPAVRERVAEIRADGGVAAIDGVAVEEDVPGDGAPAVSVSTLPEDEYGRLGVRPTPDDGERHSEVSLLDESSRPHRTPSGPEITYTDQGRAIGKHLIDVHDGLRSELDELRRIIGEVKEGAMSAGDARSALGEMALRQNDWTLGAFCSRYCRAVSQHHSLEDDAIFPHLATSDSTLGPVIDQLTKEHLTIHDAIEDVDRALVAHINDPKDFDVLTDAIDQLADALLSHLSYEEQELVEPLARLGFYSGQIRG